MDEETIKGIFTRMHQSLRMLRLIDENRTNNELTVAKLYDQFLEQSHELPERHFFCNHQFFMGTLLAFIVLPQAKIMQIPRTSINELDANWGLQRVEIVGPENGGPIALQYLVRRLRNSIAHARFDTDRDLNLLFEDGPIGGAINFMVKIRLEDLDRFCRRFNEWIITGK